MDDRQRTCWYERHTLVAHGLSERVLEVTRWADGRAVSVNPKERDLIVALRASGVKVFEDGCIAVGEVATVACSEDW